jgi:hypothetical protein
MNVLTTLLTDIPKLFSKDFLFASFLPVLLFGLACACSFTAVVGLDGFLHRFSRWNLEQRFLGGVLFSVVLILMSYIYNAFRPQIVSLWTGESKLWRWIPSLHRGLLLGQERRFDWYSKTVSQDDIRSTAWAMIKSEFQAMSKRKYNKFLRQPNDTDQTTITKLLDKIKVTTTPQSFRNLVLGSADTVEHLYETLHGDALEAVNQQVLEVIERSVVAVGRSLVELDTRFPPRDKLLPTAIGNQLAASINTYPYTRYSIEGELLWPRMQAVLDSKVREPIDDAKTLMEFGLGTATLSVVYVYLCLTVGLWLDWDLAFWGVQAVLGLIVVVVNFQVGCDAAAQLGERIRSAYDLYHLPLLEALGRPRPGDLAEARAQWAQQSRLAAYRQGLLDGAQVKYGKKP